MSKIVSNNISPRSGDTVTVNGNISVGGTLTYEDVTNVDSVGIITARSGLVVSAGGANIVGDVTVADKIVHSGDTNTSIRFPAADTFTVETGGNERLRVTSGGLIDVSGGIQVSENVTPSSGAGLELFREGGGAGQVQAYDRDNGTQLPLILKASQIQIFSGGNTERLRITSTGGVNFNNGELIERVKITAGKLSDNTNINLEDGMAHLFTTTETTTSTPNIRVNSSTTLNSVMAVGDVISVNIITTAAAAGYSAQLTIDGVAVTERWNGGSAPSTGGSSGNDFYTYSIIKTGDAAYTVLANVANFA